MTKTYVVSGRGTKFDDTPWQVPADVEIHFYFQCLREPQLYKTRTILDKLMREVGMFPDRVAVAGELIPTHVCWAHPAPGMTSGVYRRQSGQLALDLSGAVPGRPVTMSHIVRELSDGRVRRATAIHWIVRAEEAPDDPAALELLFPRRLRHGQSEDGAESHLLPLAALQMR